jgi:2-polyprenyl-6-methoxyphenol hydroxylase-like FAD-dependent oxidoreductase
MKHIQNKKIAIVGGGPGGLTLARLLQMQGANVTVYERDLHKDARPKGATLDLHDDSGLKALKAADLMDAFRANYRPGADKLRITDNNATILFADDEGGEEERGRPEIDRGPLQQILLDSLQPDTVLWNMRFVSLAQESGKIRLQFENGTSVLADLVIAADGANSKIRPYITPVKPFYSGVTAVEGTVYNSAVAAPKMHALLNGGKIFAFGNEQVLIVSSKGDGSLVFYTGCKTEEHWVKNSGINFSDKAQVVKWFKETYTSWSTAWEELFENADQQFIPRTLYCMPFDQSWETLPNLTMLGDAAHLMPPFAGEGVNMAMLDALELSEHLASDKYPDLPAALTAFEKQMLIRASESAKMTMESTNALHSKGAVDYMMQVIS